VIQWIQFFACKKLSAAGKFACGIRKLQYAKIMFCNTAGRNKIKIRKWLRDQKFLLPSTILILTQAYPAIPLSGRSTLVRRYLQDNQKNASAGVIFENYLTVGQIIGGMRYNKPVKGVGGG
jgi:hypothetical protein